MGSGTDKYYNTLKFFFYSFLPKGSKKISGLKYFLK